MGMKMAGTPGQQGRKAEASESFDHFFKNTGMLMLASLEKSVERHDNALRDLFIRMYEVRLAKAEGKGADGFAERTARAEETYSAAVKEMFCDAMNALSWGENVPLIDAMHDKGLLKFFAKVAKEGKLGNRKVLLETVKDARNIVVKIVEEQETAANIYAGLIAMDTGPDNTRYCGVGGEPRRPTRQYLQLLTASGRKALGTA